MKPFVSVITPTYNRRKFLPMLIYQYQTQTYPRDRRELIILDDSEKANDDIIPKDDKSIRYIYMKEKMPLSNKRNKLNELAKGEVIVCFDDDDFHHPERVEHSVKRLNQFRVDIVGSTMVPIYFSDIKRIMEFGPFSPTHGTNGTFAYTRNYIRNHKHEEGKNSQEEPSFTKNFNEKLGQLDPWKTILCISHNYNTFDKKNMFENTNKKITKYRLKLFIKDKKTLEFFDKLADDYTEEQRQISFAKFDKAEKHQEMVEKLKIEELKKQKQNKNN
jgi:glycosyltransferase involved in cell wall biosynthesis